MKSLIKHHIAPLCIILVLSIGLTQLVTAEDYDLAEVERATLANDVDRLGEIYQSSEGRVKHVAGFRLVSLQLFVLQNTEAGKRVLADLVAELEGSLQQTRKNGEGWAMLASLRGMQIVTAPEYAAVYAPKVGQEFALAMDYGREHPVVYLLQAMNLYNTPEQYGGSKQKALALFNRSVELYDKDADKEHWGFMDVYAWRGQTLLELGHKEKARADFEQALSYAPHSPWLQGLLASAN